MVERIEECVDEVCLNWKFSETDQTIEAPRDDMYLIKDSNPNEVYDKIKEACKHAGIGENELNHRVFVTPYEDGTFVRIMLQDR